MGKNIIQQARGKGGPTYRAPSFRYVGLIAHPKEQMGKMSGTVVELVHCAGHSAPLAHIKYENGETCYMAAPEGIKVGDKVENNGENADLGNTMALGHIPEGTLIFNIESVPGDGGKFARAGGTAARILSKSEKNVLVQLPSKKQKSFDIKCRANIGVIAGGGRLDKPLLKAGVAYYKYKARNKLWPIVCGVSMNAVDHPYGGKSSHHKGRPTIARRNAPPGAKVGKVRPRQTGRKKGKRVIESIE